MLNVQYAEQIYIENVLHTEHFWLYLTMYA